MFHGRYRIDLGLDFIVEQYWLIFNSVKRSILKVINRTSEFKEVQLSENVDPTAGFDVLDAFEDNYKTK